MENGTTNRYVPPHLRTGQATTETRGASSIGGKGVGSAAASDNTAPPAAVSDVRTRRWAKKNQSTNSSGDVNMLPTHTNSERLSPSNGSTEKCSKGKGIEENRRSCGKVSDAKAYPPRKGPGVGKGSFAAGPYAAGARSAYLERYRKDVARLLERADLSEDTRWADSHCHLESILGRTWRGGGKPQVLDNEPLVNLLELVQLWPEGLDCCVSNFAFRRPSKPGHPPEWSWLESNLHHFEDGPVADKLWFTIGIHPHDASNWDSVAEQTVRNLAKHPKCVGVGECGLDFFKHDKSETDKQLRAFRAQASLAVELGKALVVHGRLVTPEHEDLCLRVLTEIVPPEHPIHIHCYSDSLALAETLCNHYENLRIGFTGSITFRDRPSKGTAAKGGGTEKKGEAHSRELVVGLPLERLLLETDGPYMCPEPFRGQTAHPGHVHRVAEQIAEWKRVRLDAVMQATRRSTLVVYGI